MPSSTVLMMDTFQEGSYLLRAKAGSPFSDSQTEEGMASHFACQMHILGEKHLEIHRSLLLFRMEKYCSSKDQLLRFFLFCFCMYELLNIWDKSRF